MAPYYSQRATDRSTVEEPGDGMFNEIGYAITDMFLHHVFVETAKVCAGWDVPSNQTPNTYHTRSCTCWGKKGIVLAIQRLDTTAPEIAATGSSFRPFLLSPLHENREISEPISFTQFIHLLPSVGAQ
eukprot:TRINITY_DN6607_c0_g1_i2.p1 TRINITY_DN6607_c0_g1~~TRINITY_DN6607_c0_g1_i2.p1  ORF type:complete len:128 (+),score=7.69 TRINITY_DN6607_c0_g1_i2:33-416(+)